MQDVHCMQCLQPFQCLLGHTPDEAFIDGSTIVLGTGDELEQVATLEALGDDTEAVGELIEEGVAVGQDEGAVETGQDADLVQTVGHLLLGERGDAHLLEGVFASVLPATDAVDCREGALAQLGDHGVLIHRIILTNQSTTELTQHFRINSNKPQISYQHKSYFPYELGVESSPQPCPPILFIAYNEMKQSEEAESSPSEKSLLRLHYFHIRGVGQPVRHLLYYLGVPFEEILHEREEVEVGFDIGLPFLQDGLTRVHETVAIMQYLCLKYERQTLTGLTPQSIARTQEVLIKYSAQRKRIMSILFEAFSAIPSTPANAQNALVHGHLRKLTSECRFMEFCLRALARGKEWVLEELTIVDFLFYELCFYICGFLEAYIEPTSPYALLPAYMRRFQQLPFYERHRADIEQRPLFHLFASPQINAIIEQTWKGPRGPELLRKSPINEPTA